MDETTLEIVQPENLDEFVKANFRESCHNFHMLSSYMKVNRCLILKRSGKSAYFIVTFFMDEMYVLVAEGEGLINRSSIKILEKLAEVHGCNQMVAYNVRNPKLKSVLKKMGFIESGRNLDKVIHHGIIQ